MNIETKEFSGNQFFKLINKSIVSILRGDFLGLQKRCGFETYTQSRVNYVLLNTGKITFLFFLFGRHKLVNIEKENFVHELLTSFQVHHLN